MAGYRGREVGENLAWGAPGLETPADAVRTWMGSPRHRANLLRVSFRDAGIGVGDAMPTGRPGATYTLTVGAP